MKKLMIAAAIVCAAAFVQAATVQWKSGNGTKGVTSATNGTFSNVNAPSASLMIYTWDLGNATTYENFDTSKLWGSTTYTLANAKAKNATAAGGSLGATASWGTGVNDTHYYAAVLITLDTNADGEADWYIANKATQYINTAGTVTGDYSNLFKYPEGDANKTPFKGWTAVPEPTSGLLLLLGVAGLALKRKRA